MKWLICVQTPYNSVRYITDELNEYSISSYNNFYKMISVMKIINPNGYKEAVDSFETVFLDCETYEWNILKKQIDNNYTEQELHELNPSPEIKDELEKDNTIIDRTKNFIQQFNKEKVNLNMNKFKDKKLNNGVHNIVTGNRKKFN